MIENHLGYVNYLAVRLEPLTRGYAVALSIHRKKPAGARNYRGKKQEQMLGLAPGVLYGLPTGSVLVSVVGSGSCIVYPDQPDKVSDLVLAGVPSRLARVLMNELHHVFRSE